jgi:curved DNA-binding protein CbpA
MKRATPAFWTELQRRCDLLPQQTYYQILEVDRAANAETIAEAYRTLSKVLHPDRHARESAEHKQLLTRLYARISEAHRILSDAPRRRDYDRALQSGELRYQRGGTTDDAPKSPQAQALYREGLALLAQGQKKAATAKLQLALSFENECKAIQSALSRARGARAATEEGTSGASALAFQPTQLPSEPISVPTNPPAAPTERTEPIAAPTAPAEPPPAAPSTDGLVARQHPRFPIGKPIKVHCKKWDQVKTLYSNNISRGGMLLRSKDELPIGSIVEIAIVVPSGESLELPAEVVRHVPPKEPGLRIGLGVRFLAIPDPVRHKFEELIATAARRARQPIAERPPVERPTIDQRPVDQRPVEQPTSHSSIFSLDNAHMSARLAVSQGKYAEACRMLQPLLQASPNDRMLRALYHLAAGYLAKQRGQVEAARSHFERTLRYDPHSQAAVAELRGGGNH